MRKKMEADIDRMVAENQSGRSVTEEFNEIFGKTVIEHYLCKFHCFYFLFVLQVADISNHFLHLNTAAHCDPELASENQAFELKQNLCDFFSYLHSTYLIPFIS